MEFSTPGPGRTFLHDGGLGQEGGLQIAGLELNALNSAGAVLQPPDSKT